MRGNVVVNRPMSVDGFIAAPGDGMGWIFDFVRPDASWLKEIAADTRAMRLGRRTDEVGSRMEAAQDRSTEARGEGYAGSGPVFALTHKPPNPAKSGRGLPHRRHRGCGRHGPAGGKNLQILGADVAAQCLGRGLVDEIVVCLLPVLLGAAILFYSSQDSREKT